MRYILSLIVENKHGVLAKVSQVITGRGFNINTLSVGPSERDDTARMILTLECDERTIEQITKQLNKLIDIIKVFLIEEDDSVERELVLIRVRRSPKTENSLYKIVEIFNGRFIHVSSNDLVIELTGKPKKVDAFIQNMESYTIEDLMRTGPLALTKFKM